MPETVRTLLSALGPDPWRRSTPFSEDIAAIHAAVFAPEPEPARAAAAIRSWLERRQPCLFGRIAAKYDLLSFCLLTEEDLKGPDEAIRDKIQGCRMEWSRLAYEGKKSGFIVIALSPMIAEAIPDVRMLRLAQRVGELYLEHEVAPDQIYLDSIRLEAPAYERPTWEWATGVNYFCAQGDRRWWHDHRFPGGMAFSVNSVGHMVKSGVIARASQELLSLLDVPEDNWFPPKVESLPQALELAMRTIALASQAVSGRATFLLPMPENTAGLAVPVCPVQLPPSLRDKNFCEYAGYYHTDVTLPSEYFRAEVERPADVRERTLDFTYLFDSKLDNPDYRVVGVGRRVRMFDEEGDAEGEGVSILDATDDAPDLIEALGAVLQDAGSKGYKLAKSAKGFGRPKR